MLIQSPVQLSHRTSVQTNKAAQRGSMNKAQYGEEIAKQATQQQAYGSLKHSTANTKMTAAYTSNKGL